jgi:ribose transport system ATP-binding protein
MAVEPMAALTPGRIVALMVGRDLGEGPEPPARRPGPVRLRVEGLGRGEAVRDVSFEVRAGEIFGVAGLVGAGRSELLRLIYGADRPDRGAVALGDPPQRARIRSPADAVRHGLALAPEDREGDGLLGSFSIAANLALGNMRAVASGGVIDRAREAALAGRRMAALRVRARDPDQPVATLSGGNQQKVLIGRALEREARVLLVDEPTRGVDVAAKFDIHQLFGELAAAGAAIVVVSSDLRELMQIADRIGVMSAGRLVAVFRRGEWSEAGLLAAAFSGYAGQDAALRAPAAEARA